MKRSDTAMARRIDDDLVILDVTSGRYFEVNDVGALVWEHLDGTRTVEDLIDTVLAEFDAPRDLVTIDVENLLGQLIRAGLVVADP